MERTASIPSNWSSSSNQQMAGKPLVNLMPLSFSGSSAPRKTMRCPVGRYVISMGESFVLKYASRPREDIAQSTCWYTESRNVFPNRLTTTAFA